MMLTLLIAYNTAVEFVAVGHRPTFHLDHSDHWRTGG